MIAAKLFVGGLGGLVATAPMTIAMEVLHRWLPQQEQYPLPPSEITAELTDETGTSKHLSPQQHQLLTLINHFAYGAAAGSFYGLLAAKLPLAPAVKGAGYGIGVWSVSYLGLLPALGLLRPATQHPARRSALMIVAHVVWGSALGWLVAQLQTRIVAA